MDAKVVKKCKKMRKIKDGIQTPRNYCFAIFTLHVFPINLFYHTQQSTQATFFQRENHSLSLIEKE